MGFLFNGLIAGAVAGFAYQQWRTNMALLASVNALIEEVADSTTKLASIKAFIEGVPDLVGQAVTDALEAANVETQEAAALINTARTTISDKVDAVLAAVEANTPAEPTPADPPEDDAA